jgi:hypothetical protein
MNEYSNQICTVEVNESKSDFAYTLGYKVVGIYVPAGFTGNELVFYADPTGVIEDALVYNVFADAVILNVSTLPAMIGVPTVHDTVQGNDKGPLPPAARYAVQSRNNGTPVVQVSEVEIQLILERMQV